jgi:hypothetical protein
MKYDNRDLKANNPNKDLKTKIAHAEIIFENFETAWQPCF